MNTFFIRLARLVKALIITVIGLCSASLIVVLVLMIWVTRWFPGDAEFPRECAVVFGAAVRAGDQPGPGIARRTATAVRLYEQEFVERLYMTGGRGDTYQESEAQVMKDYAMELGVPETAITIEESSHNTWENLQNTAPLAADCTTVVGISDRYHLARIQHFAERMGWEDFQVYPADYLAGPAFELHSVTREAFAMIYSFVAPQYD